MVNTLKHRKELNMKKINKEELLLQAKERLIQKGFKIQAKKEVDGMLEFMRPEYMTSDIFKNKCFEVAEKFKKLAESDVYDEYEKIVILNTSNQVYEIMLKAYLTVCYYN